MSYYDLFHKNDVTNAYNDNEYREKKDFFCKLCGSKIDRETRRCVSCGKHYIKKFHVFIWILALITFFIILVVAYKMGENKGYQNGIYVNENGTNVKTKSYEDSNDKKEDQITNSVWKESARKSLENRGFYDEEISKKETNNSRPVITQEDSTNSITNSTDVSGLRENK